jgi:NADPH:quinone reductase-like Zn-dependent oxidoreductase
VLVGGEGGGRWLGGTDRQLRALALSPFIKQNLRGLMSVERKEDLRFLSGLIEDGNVVPVIDRTYALQEVPEAIRYVKAGRARGKVLITV